jgi:putative addiction module CopG family antidote
MRVGILGSGRTGCRKVAPASAKLTAPHFNGRFTSMTIHLKPELEALIQKDVERGPYQSADEFVAQAVQMLHEQEQWLADNRGDIAAKIEHGYAQAERGELIEEDEAFQQLRQRHEQRRKQG